MRWEPASACTGSPGPPVEGSHHIDTRQPVVSVVLPIHNGSEYLAQAIESVLLQDVPLELIVVDDASTDGSAAICERYGSRLAYIPVAKQHSSIGTTNVGMDRARGTYVCVIHQDDYLLPGKLRKHVELMDGDASIGLSYSGQWFVGPRGEPLTRLRSPVRRGSYVIDGQEELRVLTVQNYLNYCNVVMRRDAYVTAGPFVDPLWVTADWWLWLRIALHHRVGYVDELLTCYRLHPGAQTLARRQDSGAWAEQARQVIDGFYADPEVPPSLQARRPLTQASVELTGGLLRLLRGDLRRSSRALRRTVGLAGWRALPDLLHASVIGPRAMARARMLLSLQLEPRTAWWWPLVTGAERGAFLRCPRCQAIAGYGPAWRAAAPAREARTASLRCLACSHRWERGLASAEAGFE